MLSKRLSPRFNSDVSPQGPLLWSWGSPLLGLSHRPSSACSRAVGSVWWCRCSGNTSGALYGVARERRAEQPRWFLSDHLHI